jgi:hypothetical protein
MDYIMSVSFLIPSRGRIDIIKKTIVSIVDRNSYTLDFDILVRMDYDECFDCDVLLEWCIKHDYDKYVKIFCGHRYFYENIHKYFNELSFLSKKKWLWLWNDETLMLSNNWDQIISPYLNKFVLLFPKQNSCFHLCPKKLVEIIGYYAPTTNCDSWQGKLATDLGLVQWIDIEILHDRYDITGNNLDQTFLNRNYINNIESKINNNEKEIIKIRSYLEKFGQNF